MASQNKNNENKNKDTASKAVTGRLVPRDIGIEMRESYLDYAMSVITSRALPDVRDGLKPVHRRILYTMQQMGLTTSAKFRKSAAVVGDCMGRYHPHGDLSIYDALVKMAQDFSYRYPLVVGQGNFGCFTKDTKVRLADGRALSFGDIIREEKEGKKNYTFTITETGEIDIAPIQHPRLTRENAEIMKVILDNGREIRCTLDHKFLLKDGSYVAAKDLQRGVSLMPLYARVSNEQDTRLKLYPNKAATRWETGLSKHYSGDTGRITAEIQGNHKVKKIIFLRQKEDVYDLTINTTHNFALDAGVFVHNSTDGDPQAAMRYTEAKMSRVAGELLRDLEKETVDMRGNYDGTRLEPTVLPSALPNVLLNGALGIAVGMATNIPPHNLREIVDATIRLIENPQATTDELLGFVKGPDFPTGGIAYSVRDIAQAYATGRGGVVVRGEAEIMEDKSGNPQIIITSLPYRVNKSEFVARIAELVHEKKLEGVKALRDESSRGETRVAVDLKQGVHAQKVLNYIYKHTELETVFHYNMLALVHGVPQTLSLKGILGEFIAHREEVVKRRTSFDLARAEEREHILSGLKKALDQIDEVIATIRKSKDTSTAHKNLEEKFSFTAIQATAILEMRLQKLAGLERLAVEDELKEKRAFIKDLKELLASRAKISGVVKTELKESAEKYGDERKTKIVRSGIQALSDEDLIPDEESILVVTQGGYIKRTNPSEYRRQKRGGVGVIDLHTKEEDFVTLFLTASTHANVLFFTNKGRAYQTRMYEIPEGKRATRGKSIMNFLQLSGEEQVTSVLAVPKELRSVKKLGLVIATEHGMVKKTAAEKFLDVRRSGILAMKLRAGDKLLVARFAEYGDNIILTTKKAQAIRFKESAVREMGRSAGGVRGIRLRTGDVVVGADVIKEAEKDADLLVMSAKGIGKKSALKEYKVQGRGGSGIKTARLSPKTGDLIGAEVVTAETNEIVAISKQSVVIRTGLSEVSRLGRAAQGVRIMKLRPGDSAATFICL